MYYRNVIIITVCILLLTSCFKEEKGEENIQNIDKINTINKKDSILDGKVIIIPELTNQPDL